MSPTLFDIIGAALRQMDATGNVDHDVMINGILDHLMLPGSMTMGELRERIYHPPVYIDQFGNPLPQTPTTAMADVEAKLTQLRLAFRQIVGEGYGVENLRVGTPFAVHEPSGLATWQWILVLDALVAHEVPR